MDIDQSRKDEIAANLEAVRADVRAAAEEAGRDPESVQLLPVTKFHPASDVAILAELGVGLVGENREQEARGKVEELGEVGVVTHFAMIGQIQTKKANAVARWASEVHSLDSVKLADALERGMALALERGDRESGTLPCMIQISFDEDESRGGAHHENLDEIIAAVESAQHLLLDGFMVVPPLNAEPNDIFETSRAIADSYADRLGRKMRLSAGMSGDFPQAIACGSDVVRVGTRLLGDRPVG